MEIGDMDFLSSSDDDDEGGEEDETTESCPPGEALEINGELWRGLPRDVLHQLLRHLPVASVIRSRAVCREWNHLLSSSPFILSRSVLPTPPDDLCFALFSPSRPAPSFSFLSPHSSLWSTISLSSFLPFPSLRILSSSASGLVCLRASLDSSLRLIVCNPLSRSLCLLPPLLRRRLVPVVSLVPSDSHPDAFYVVVAGDDFSPAFPSVADLTTEVYDSRSDRWSLAGPIPPGSELDFGAVFLNGNLYFPTCRPLEGILCFNPRDGVWSKVRAMMPPEAISPRFAAGGGKMFMVSGIGSYGGCGMEGIKVWVLCAGDRLWRGFARMKKWVFERVFVPEDGKSELNFRVVGHGTMICLIFHGRVEIVAIDVKTKKWAVLPAHPSFCASPSSSSSTAAEFFGSPFTPRLQTPVD